MKKSNKLLFITIFAIILTLFNITYVFAEEGETSVPSVTAKSYIVLDNKTNKTIYNKNENEKMYPASTTKILTAILVLENCNLEDKVTASYDAIMDIPSGYSSANIQVDEEFTVEQLLQLLLVHSANDAANVLAEHVGGSVDSFVSMMNTKVDELGLSNTHFTNTYGKHDDNHYTSSSVLAAIMKYCLKNDIFSVNAVNITLTMRKSSALNAL
jgi:D-alanyl-D-alanine carboxypeptidase